MNNLQPMSVLVALPNELGIFFHKYKPRHETQEGRFIFREYLLHNRNWVVLCTGMGKEKAAEGTQRLIDRYNPAGIINPGFSGYTAEELSVKNKVFLPRTIIDLDENLKPTGSITLPMESWNKWGIKLPYEDKPLLTSPKVVASSEEKYQLGIEHPGALIDMESYAAAQVCQKTGTPYLSLRIVMDGANRPLRINPTPLLDAQGQVRPAAAIKYLMCHPQYLGEAYYLWEVSHRLSKILTREVESIAIQWEKNTQA